MNLSFIDTSESSEQSSAAPRLNRSCTARSSIRKNLTKKMFVNNITQQICDMRRKELRLKQREMILNAKERELMEREKILLERERIQESHSYCCLSPRTRSVTFDQLNSIDSELETTDIRQQHSMPVKSRKKTTFFSFFRFKSSKRATQSKVNKLVNEILLTDEQETLMNALEVLSKMGSKDASRRSCQNGGKRV